MFKIYNFFTSIQKSDLYPTIYDILPIATGKLEKHAFYLHLQKKRNTFSLDKADPLWQYIVEVFMKWHKI